jgi:WD40 repeat protein
VASLAGHAADVWSVAFRQDGRVLASASRDGEVRLWRRVPGDEGWAPLLVTHAGAGSVRALVFGLGDSEGALAAAGDGGRLRVWETGALEPAEEGGERAGWETPPETPREEAEEEEETVVPDEEAVGVDEVMSEDVGGVGAAALLPRERVLAVVEPDGSCALWDLRAVRRTGRLLPHAGSVTCVAAAERQLGRDAGVPASLLASGGSDGTLRLTRVLLGASTGGARFALCRPGGAPAHDGAVTALAVGADNATLLSAGQDGAVAVWSLARRELLSAHAHDAPVTAAALHAPGEPGGAGRALVAFAGGHPPAIAWTGHAPRGLVFVRDATLGAALGTPIAAHEGLQVREIAFVQDGRRVASCAEGDATVCVSDVQTSAPVMRLAGHSAPVLSLAAAPAEWAGPPGKRAPTEREALARGTLITAGRDRMVRLWALGDGAELCAAEAPGEVASSLAVARVPVSGAEASGAEAPEAGRVEPGGVAWGDGSVFAGVGAAGGARVWRVRGLLRTHAKSFSAEKGASRGPSLASSISRGPGLSRETSIVSPGRARSPLTRETSLVSPDRASSPSQRREAPQPSRAPSAATSPLASARGGVAAAAAAAAALVQAAAEPVALETVAQMPAPGELERRARGALSRMREALGLPYEWASAGGDAAGGGKEDGARDGSGDDEEEGGAESPGARRAARKADAVPESAARGAAYVQASRLAARLAAVHVQDPAATLAAAQAERNERFRARLAAEADALAALSDAERRRAARLRGPPPTAPAGPPLSSDESTARRRAVVAQLVGQVASVAPAGHRLAVRALLRHVRCSYDQHIRRLAVWGIAQLVGRAAPRTEGQDWDAAGEAGAEDEDEDEEEEEDDEGSGSDDGDGASPPADGRANAVQFGVEEPRRRAVRAERRVRRAERAMAQAEAESAELDQVHPPESLPHPLEPLPPAARARGIPGPPRGLHGTARARSARSTAPALRAEWAGVTGAHAVPRGAAAGAAGGGARQAQGAGAAR